METLFNQLCDKFPDFEESLNVFSEKEKLIIFEKNKNLKNETEFTSTLAELDFGRLFNKLGFDLEYDKPYNKQTPDWTISIGDSIAICEVYRLGKSKKDQIMFEYISRLTKKARELQFNYIIKLKILNADFDTSDEKLFSIVQNLKNWLSSSPKEIGDELLIEHSIEFTIKKINTNSKHLICYSYRLIEFKPEKIIQLDY
ncbi:MAG: hypothetical protein GX273_01825 [Bacteroidales bacterium]|nr:hypothetical protein [Bacteroidales bacterium]